MNDRANFLAVRLEELSKRRCVSTFHPLVLQLCTPFGPGFA